MKIILVLVGILLILAGLFLTFGIWLSSAKEENGEGYYGFIFSFGLVGLGVYCVVKSVKLIRRRRS